MKIWYKSFWYKETILDNDGFIPNISSNKCKL